MYKSVLLILFSVILYPAFAQRPTDTFKLYFDLDVPTLNESMERKIDLLIYNDKIISGSGVMIVGYADYLGSEGYNKNLSMRRAENVKNYLVKYGINPNDITLCMGKGKVDRSLTGKEGYPTDRRVDIVVNNITKKPGKPITAKKPAKPQKDTIRKTTLTNFDQIKNLKPGTTFLLKNVYFPADRHIIKPESYKTLEKLYEVLRDNPKLKISIEGHVCCIRDVADALDVDTYEPYLSVNRAKEIYKYLVSKGIESARLNYSGYGKSRPVVANEMSEEDAEKNRRVEVRIIEQ
jgi:outer membrane protein OmpA-like peptidoglycan-associated protein